MSDPSTAKTTGSSKETGTSWFNPWCWPSGIWAVVIGGFVISLPFLVRMWFLSAIPDMPVPFDVAELVTWDVPAHMDAFEDYHRASNLRERIVRDAGSQGSVLQEPEDCMVVLKEGWEQADDGMKNWMEVHHEALEVWRQGTEKDRGRNLSPDKFAINTLLPTIQNQRLFCRLAMMEEARLLSEGKTDEARQWARASFRSGGHTTYRGCLIQSLVGTAIHAVSCDGLIKWSEQPTVTSAELKQALADARSDYGLYESPSNVLKVEYIAMQNSFRSRNWLQLMGPLGPNSNSPSVMRMGYWVIGEPDLTMRLFRQTLANQIQEIDKPVTKRRKMAASKSAYLFDPDPTVKPLPGQVSPARIDIANRRSLFFRLLSPAIHQYDIATQRQIARQAALELALAAQAFRRDHGEFPEKAADLVPQYLPSIPLDPWDLTGGAMNYRRDEAGHGVVWSVGDDQRDDGGDVINPKNGRSPDVGYVLE